MGYQSVRKEEEVISLNDEGDKKEIERKIEECRSLNRREEILLEQYLKF